MTLEYLYSDFGQQEKEKKFFVFLSTATALTSGRQTITDPGTKYFCIKTNFPPLYSAMFLGWGGVLFL